MKIDLADASLALLAPMAVAQERWRLRRGPRRPRRNRR